MFVDPVDSHINTDGALYRYSGQVYLTVDDNFYIRDSDGSTRFHLNSNGGLKLNEQTPIQFRRYKNLGDNINYDTGYSSSDFNAAITGFRTIDVDINEGGGNGNFLQLYMHISNSKWYIRADLRSHNDNEDWYVDVMYVRKEISTRSGY